MNNNVRKITEGAMMCAIIGVILFINRQFAGLLELYFMWFVPLPIILYTAKYSLKDGLVVATSVFFLTFLFGTFQTIFYVFMALACGLSYGYGVSKHYSNLRLLIQTAVITTFLAIITSIIFASFFGYDILGEISTLKDMIVQYMPNVENQLSMDLSRILLLTFYLGNILTGFIEAIIVHFFAMVLLKRFGYKINPMKPLNEISIPKYLAYLCFIACIVMSYIPLLNLSEKAQEVLYVLGLLGGIILFSFGFIFCIVFGMLKYKKNITFILVIVLLFTFTISLPILVVLGFLYQTTSMLDMLLRRK